MTMTAYTDGACLGNPGPGGWGVVLAEDGATREELSGSAVDTTNNRMELWAALEALERTAPTTALRIVTDSKYVHDGATKWLAGWKRKGWRASGGGAVKNRDLWEKLDARVNARSARVEWRWVKGHAGHTGNERADRLASAAAKAARRAPEKFREAMPPSALSLTGTYTVGSLIEALSRMPSTTATVIHGRIDIG